MFIVIVGSKSDLANNRAVPIAYAKKFQKTMPNCSFTTETSAYEDITTIKQLFDEIGSSIIEQGHYTTQ